MTSNFTMLGPILLYWLATIMIMVGWVTDHDIMFTGRWVGKFFLWVLLTFISSFYQISWIDSIRDLYSGDSWVFEEVESIQNSVEDTTVNERLLWNSQLDYLIRSDLIIYIKLLFSQFFPGVPLGVVKLICYWSGLSTAKKLNSFARIFILLSCSSLEIPASFGSSQPTLNYLPALVNPSFPILLRSTSDSCSSP